MIAHHPTPASARTPFAKYRQAIILAALLGIGSVLSFGNSYWLDNSVTIAIYSLMALSVGISYGQAGILSMATAAFASIGAYGTAILSTRYGLSPLVGLLFAISAPMLLGYLLARVIGRLSPLPLAIATFMLSDLIGLAIREGGDFTGGFVGLSGIPRLGIAPDAQAFHFVAWGAVLVVLVLYINLMNSSVGRAINTARHDPLRAKADGVNVPQVISLTFAVSSAVAGIAGWLYAHHVTYMGPDSMTTHLSMNVILMAVVGGARVFLGPVCGAAVLLVIGLYMPAAESQGMIFGAILVLVLLVAPQGLLGVAWKKILRKKTRGGAGSTPAPARATKRTSTLLGETSR
jgi:branched-chain amino acid transport system permease protein